MIDKTTAGYTAKPDEVEALLHNLCGYHLAERDALLRYEALTREQVLYDALVAAIRRERGRAVAEIIQAGHKITHVAELTKLGSRQRVQRLIAIARAAEVSVVEAAVVAGAAAAEAGVARELGAAVLESVNELAAEGFFEPAAHAPTAPAHLAALPEPPAPYRHRGAHEYRRPHRDEAPAARDDSPFGARPDWTDLAEAPYESQYEASYEVDFEPHPDAVPEIDPRFDVAADPEAVLEPTLMMPTIVESTREMPVSERPGTEEVSWWRRGRDSTARSA
jgi:hypothetical protein